MKTDGSSAGPPRTERLDMALPREINQVYKTLIVSDTKATIRMSVGSTIKAKCAALIYPWLAVFAAVAVITCGNVSSSAAVEPEADPGTVRQKDGTPGGTENAENAPRHTPLAGEAYKTTFLGRTVEIPARDRNNILSLSLGTNLYSPEVGGDVALPIAALYWQHRWEKLWSRAIVGLFVNEVDVARSFGKFQLLGHFDNNTIPFADTDVQDGKEIKTSSVIWGTVSGWLGAGIRIPVYPYQADNDLRIQLFYHAGYFYDSRTSDTGPDVRLPPDTFFHGLRLRARYDGIRRNIMELPHEGWAAGSDLELTRRDNWSDSSIAGTNFSRNDTRDYLKFSGYLVGATGLPWLSERHRFVGYLHAGISPVGRLDRFSSFRAGAGPFPNETNDLYRVPYPGALYNTFPVTDYAIATLEYRLELLFFMYLHLRGTVAWGANRPDFSADELRLRFTGTDGEAFSVGLTSGFFKDSQIYLEYAYDNKFIRNGSSGHSFTVLWSKMF